MQLILFKDNANRMQNFHACMKKLCFDSSYFSGLNVSYVLSSKKILISVIFLGGLSL